MKNKEKYVDEIMQIIIDDETLAVSKETNKPMNCSNARCINCLFGEMCSSNKRKEWLEAEYVEPSIDWSKVEVDTKILVSENGKNWSKRHFSKYKNGKVYSWFNGGTSWSTIETMAWKYAKLYEGEKE